MFNFKNNFLWEFIANAKFQNPIEKFDKEFWEKTEEAVKGDNELLKHEAKKIVKRVTQEKDVSFFKSV